VRVLVTGDKHLGLVSDGVSRLEEQGVILERCVELLSHFNPDVYVDLGDMFHSPRPGPDAYELAFRYLRDLAAWRWERKGRHAFVLAGNHDKSTRGCSNALSPLLGFQKLPQVILAPMEKGIGLADGVPPTSTWGGALFLFLPFVTEWEARTVFGVDGAQTLLDNAAARALAVATKDAPVVVFSHLEVPGAKRNDWDVSQRDVGLHVPDVLLDDDRVLGIYAGHIHRHQVLGNVVVVGSAIHVDFGEASDQKGALLVEF